MDVSGLLAAIRYHGDTKRPGIAESCGRHRDIAQSTPATLLGVRQPGDLVSATARARLRCASQITGWRSMKRIVVPGGYWPGMLRGPGRRTSIFLPRSKGASVARLRWLVSEKMVSFSTKFST